jgi:small subunit ribosomal protein S4e
MVKNHLKTIAAPKMWPVHRKSRKFMLRPNPGPHSLKSSVSLNFLLIELVNIAKTKKESVSILYKKEVLVNGKRRKEIEFPVGLFDVISIPEIKKHYRIGITKKGRLFAFVIDAKESNAKAYKIRDKKIVAKKTELNFSDGTNLVVEKDSYKVGDTLYIDFLKNNIIEHMKLEKGNTIFLTGGRHIGSLGKVEDIIGSKIVYKIKSNDVHETLKEYAFVIGHDSPIFKIEA